MTTVRALVLAALVATSMVAMAIPGTAVAAPAPDHAQPSPVDGSTPQAGTAGPDERRGPDALDARQDDDDDDPSTEGTIGYVEGRWYDDELPVDDRDDAALDEADLEAVVHRSMARVEVVRNLTFEDDVPVDVITREAYEGEAGEMYADASDAERLHHNVRFEALFMADRDTDALEELGALHAGSVLGYYDPEAERIVLVSDSTEAPEVDEITLGHELTHALQDQRFGLGEYERETRDDANAIDGLVEGDAGWVESAYVERCETEWNCVRPGSEGEQAAPPTNWGMYFTIYQPYSDGPSFVDHLRAERGQEAVDAAYDDPPRHSSEVIHPDEYGDLDADVSVEDRSSDRWGVLEVSEAEGPDYSEFGEATMASMFIHPTYESQGLFSIVSQDEFLTDSATDPLDYDQPYTDGWAGDRLVKYVTDDESIDESGYVWQTEWESDEDAAEFVDGYLQLLEYHGAEPVDDRRNAFTIEADYPGAYHVDHDGETVTIVRAPSVDELSEIREGAAPEGEDTLEADVGWNDDDGATDDGDDGDGNDTDAETPDGAGAAADEDDIPGFGVAAAAFATLLTVLAARSR